MLMRKNKRLRGVGLSVRHELLLEHSRANADRIVGLVADDESLLVELMVCLFSDEVTVAQRAAFAVGIYGREYPARLLPWLEDLVGAIANPVHQAIRRCGVRYMSELTEPIPKSLEKRMIGLCVGFVADPETETAIGAFAMQFVADRSERYPAAAKTLIRDLKKRFPSASAGFQNRAGKLLKKLESR